jgi:hypothetical protein
MMNFENGEWVPVTVGNLNALGQDHDGDCFDTLGAWYGIHYKSAFSQA